MREMVDRLPSIGAWILSPLAIRLGAIAISASAVAFGPRPASSPAVTVVPLIAGATKSPRGMPSFPTAGTAALAIPMTAEPPTGAASPPTEGTVSYRVDPVHSRVIFEMKATLHTVEGKTSAVSGTFTRSAAPSADGFAVGGRIVIAARTLDTGNGTRDKRMRSESLAVDQFPEIVFVPSRATGSVASFTPGSTAKFKLEGSLAVRGVTKPVSLDVTARFAEQGISADGTTTMSFLDFGVPDPSNFFLRVKPNLTIKVHVEGDAAP